MKAKFQNLVLRWANENLINYPWRTDRNPYKVLISEILLTRTKAKQVTPVFNEFMRKFPTIEKFMLSRYQDLSKLVSSLGLLYRAQKLEDLKLQLKNYFKTHIPDNFDDLKSLSGIGDYAANAVLCFGFGEKYPLLDSNFIRVYLRVFKIKPKTKTAKTDKFLWEFSKNLLPNKDYINFNYGILDIGGIFCRSKNPNCIQCPVNQICKFYKLKTIN